MIKWLKYPPLNEVLVKPPTSQTVKQVAGKNQEDQVSYKLDVIFCQNSDEPMSQIGGMKALAETKFATVSNLPPSHLTDLLRLSPRRCKRSLYTDSAGLLLFNSFARDSELVCSRIYETRVARVIENEPTNSAHSTSSSKCPLAVPTRNDDARGPKPSGRPILTHDSIFPSCPPAQITKQGDKDLSLFPGCPIAQTETQDEAGVLILRSTELVKV